MLFWESVLELEECFLSVAILGSFESAICIAPVGIYADISVTFPVRLHGVVVPECFFEVEGVRFVYIFDPKVVNESERDGSGFVEVESPGAIGKVVVTNGEDFFKLLVGKFTGLFEAVDSFANFHVDVAVGSNVVV